MKTIKIAPLRFMGMLVVGMLFLLYFSLNARSYESLLCGPAVLLGLLVLWWYGVRLDYNRVRNYIERDGGNLVSMQEAPFGPGWFGNRDSAIYRIEYVDSQGRRQTAYCKTGLFAGVYITKGD